MDRYLDEDDFYKEVNKDLESRLDDIDPNEDMMADLVIGALNNHVSEIYSPPQNKCICQETWTGSRFRA